MRSLYFGEGSVAHGALVSQKLHTLPCELGLQPSPSSITRLSPALRLDTAHFGQQLLAWHGSRFRLGIALDHHHDAAFSISLPEFSGIVGGAANRPPWRTDPQRFCARCKFRRAKGLSAFCDQSPLQTKNG